MMLLLQLVFSTFTFEEGVFFAEWLNSFVDVNRSIEDEFTLDEEFWNRCRGLKTKYLVKKHM